MLPVILLTECNDTVDRILGYQMGCDLYLPKPFEMQELRAIVRNLLERSQVIHSELRFSQLTKRNELLLKRISTTIVVLRVRLRLASQN